MDEADCAQKMSDMYLGLSLAKCLSEPDNCGESLIMCVDCGATIPDGRRKAIPGCIRCVTCQELAEIA